MSFEQLRINVIGYFGKTESRDFQIASALTDLGHLLRFFDLGKKQEMLAPNFPSDLTLVLKDGLNQELIKNLPGLKVLWLGEPKKQNDKEGSNSTNGKKGFQSELYEYVFYLKGEGEPYLSQAKEFLKEIKGIKYHPNDFKLGVMFDSFGEVTLDFEEYYKAVENKLTH